jgi:hypothetical protein
MEPEAELALVRKALRSGVTNCCAWLSDKIQRRVANDPSNEGLTPKAIRELLLAHVKTQGDSAVQQRRETRDEWRNERDHWYFVLTPVEGWSRPLFVELILSDDDTDYPEVAIVNAHPSLF